MENKKGEDDLFDRLNVSAYFIQHGSCYNYFHLLLLFLKKNFFISFSWTQ